MHAASHAVPEPRSAPRRAVPAPASRSAAPAVQRWAGNRAAGVRVQACGCGGRCASCRRAKAEPAARDGQEPMGRVRVQACACGGTCASCAAKGRGEEQVQPALAVGPADDAFEREAEATAERVMRMTAAPADPRDPADGAATPRIQRIAGGAAYGMRMDAPLPMGGGRPLSPGTRAFMEPRFGADFGGVRLYEGAGAERAAEGIGARAFTYGSGVWLGRGASEGDRRLMAHELTHVVQQGHASTPPAVRRQTPPATPPTAPGPAPAPAQPPAAGPYTVHPSCAGHEAILRAAWDEGTRLTTRTIETLERVMDLNRQPGGTNRLVPAWGRYLQNAFGEVTGLDGLEPGESGITNVPRIIEKYRRIAEGFSAGKLLRCDVQTNNYAGYCRLFAAFVPEGNTTEIWICPGFFEGAGAERDTQRGTTLLHEMAHSQLRAGHAGTGDALTFGCDTALGLSFQDALRNAYAYDTLAGCLHGGHQAGEVLEAPRRPGTGPARPGDRRFTLGASVGGRVLDDTRHFASVLSGTVSLRTGELVVFNPVIGLNLVYVPGSAADPAHLATAALTAGVRIQQPLRGAYLDILGGGFVGFEANPGTRTRFTGGVEATIGGGFRWDRIEVGAAATGQLPLENLRTVDRGSLLILGRGAVRF